MWPWEAHTGVRGPWRMWGLQEPEVQSLRFLSLRFKSRCFGWVASWHSWIIPVAVRGHSSWPGTASQPMGTSQSQGSRRHTYRCLGPACQPHGLQCAFFTPHSWKGQARPTSWGQPDAFGKGSGECCLLLTREELTGPLLTSLSKAYEDTNPPGL